MITHFERDVDPFDAITILDTMGRQRRVRTAHVRALAECMKAGSWRISTIMIDDDGRLVDGQHRLRAAIAAGISMRVIVMQGPRSELLDIMRLEARTTKADDASKRLGETVSPHAQAVMAHTGCDLETADRLAALAYRVPRGGVSLAGALAGLTEEEAARFVDDLLRGTQPAAAVLGRWLALHAVRPTVTQRAGIQAACALAISRWQRGLTVAESALTRAAQ